MRLKKVFSPGSFRLKVRTNSKEILELISNSLDDGNTISTEPVTWIDFKYDLVNDNSKIVEQNPTFKYLIEGNKLSLETSGFKVAEIEVDKNRSEVKGAVNCLDEKHKEIILDFIFFAPLRTVLASSGLFFLHSSAVRRGNDVVCISGSSGRGKSTLALALARGGFQILSDDKCFLGMNEGEPTVRFLPTKMGLSDAVLRQYPELAEHTVENYRYGGKRRISLDMISARGERNDPAGCNMLLFPRYQASRKKNVFLKAISRDEALKKMLNLENLAPIDRKNKDDGKETFNNFVALFKYIKRSKSFELRYNDGLLDKIPSAVMKKLSGADIYGK